MLTREWTGGRRGCGQTRAVCSKDRHGDSHEHLLVQRAAPHPVGAPLRVLDPRRRASPGAAGAPPEEPRGEQRAARAPRHQPRLEREEPLRLAAGDAGRLDFSDGPRRATESTSAPRLLRPAAYGARRALGATRRADGAVLVRWSSSVRPSRRASSSRDARRRLQRCNILTCIRLLFRTGRLNWWIAKSRPP